MGLFRLFHKLKEQIAGNLVIKGTLILTITGFATRFIGFYNRIFLADLIGAEELGIYQLIFPLYMVAFAFTTIGNELALTKLVSEYSIRKDFSSAKTFFRLCFFINLSLGLLVSIIMYQNADWLCIHILNAPKCGNCLKIICFGIPFMAMKGAIHGYFLGLKKSGVHGVSDFLEQITKVFSLYLLSTYICIRKNYDAAFAVIGILLGEIVSFLYSIVALYLHNRKYKHVYECSNIQKPSILKANAVRLFFKDSIPLTTNRLALMVLQSIEAIMIPTVLLSFYKDSSLSLTTYGVFSGMAFPFIMFPSTITNSLSTMLLPAVSSAKSNLNQKYLTNLCNKSLHFCLLIGLFSLTAFYTFGSAIGECFFHNKEAGIFLYQLSFLCPFIYLATTLVSILNGLGFATHNLILTVIATVIRISFIVLLIPKIGMTGYIMGLFVSYLFLTFACLHKVQSVIPVTLDFTYSILIPAVIFIINSILAFIIYHKVLMPYTKIIPHFLILLGCIGIYGILSFTLLFIKSIICKVRQQPH